MAKASSAELAKVKILGRDTLAWPHLNEHLSALSIVRQQQLGTLKPGQVFGFGKVKH